MKCLHCGAVLTSESFQCTINYNGSALNGSFCNPQHFVHYLVDNGVEIDNRPKHHREGFKL